MSSKKSNFHGTKINPSSFHKSQLKFYLVLLPMALFMGLPIIYIVSHAFKPMDELFAYPPRFFAQKPTLDNFKSLFRAMNNAGTPVSRYLFNSITVTFTIIVLTILISSAAGFALSKLNFRLKKVLFNINTLALMFVPIAVGIPRYLIIVNLRLIDNYFSHIVPALAMPIGIFLLKQFIDQIPDSLMEAARIDGASDFRVFYSIIIPLIIPAIATISILSFQAAWNAIEASNLYINSENLKNFSFYMTTLTNASNAVAGQGMGAASALIMFIPNLIIFIFMQSKVMNTMAHSGIK